MVFPYGALLKGPPQFRNAFPTRRMVGIFIQQLPMMLSNN